MYEIYCQLRDKNKLKDIDVARATGITRSTFSDWKNGRYTPKQDKLQKIADYFNVTVDYLMTGNEKEEINTDVLHIVKEIEKNQDLKLLFEKIINLDNEKLMIIKNMIESWK